MFDSIQTVCRLQPVLGQIPTSMFTEVARYKVVKQFQGWKKRFNQLDKAEEKFLLTKMRTLKQTTQVDYSTQDLSVKEVCCEAAGVSP